MVTETPDANYTLLNLG